MFLFFLLSHIATAVVDERSQGSLRRLLVTPASKTVILAGKMLPFIFIAIGQMLFVLLVSSWAFKMPLGNSLPALIVIIVATALSAATLGILVAAIVENENQAGGLTILVVLVLAVISGCISESIQTGGAQPAHAALLGAAGHAQRLAARHGAGRRVAARPGAAGDVDPLLCHRGAALQV